MVRLIAICLFALTLRESHSPRTKLLVGRRKIRPKSLPQPSQAKRIKYESIQEPLDASTSEIPRLVTQNFPEDSSFGPFPKREIVNPSVDENVSRAKEILAMIPSDALSRHHQDFITTMDSLQKSYDDEVQILIDKYWKEYLVLSKKMNQIDQYRVQTEEESRLGYLKTWDETNAGLRTAYNKYIWDLSAKHPSGIADYMGNVMEDFNTHEYLNDDMKYQHGEFSEFFKSYFQNIELMSGHHYSVKRREVNKLLMKMNDELLLLNEKYREREAAHIDDYIKTMRTLDQPVRTQKVFSPRESMDIGAEVSEESLKPEFFPLTRSESIDPSEIPFYKEKLINDLKELNGAQKRGYFNPKEKSPFDDWLKYVYEEIVKDVKERRAVRVGKIKGLDCNRLDLSSSKRKKCENYPRVVKTLNMSEMEGIVNAVN